MKTTNEYQPKSNPHLEEARKVLREKGIAALYNPHAMTGKICGCGSCFCCAAFEVWKGAR